MAIYKTSASGSGLINVTHTVPTSRTYQLVSVSLNLNAAPTTSENYTITLDALAGAEYDIVLYSLDLSAGSTTDVFWFPDQPLYLVGGDAVDVAYTNTDGRTYGVQITVREA
jgi:hypothetical protein